MKYPPLKRHPALVPLSREHFNGLVQVRRLRAAAGAGAARRRAAVAGFVKNWSAEMAAHFADEERLLGPLMEPEDHRRFDDEHARLRALAAKATAEAAAERAAEGDCREEREGAAVGPEEDWMRELATLLEQHIRWEERECFERLQRARAAELAELVPAAKRIEESRAGAARRGAGRGRRRN